MAKNWLFKIFSRKSPIFLHFYARRGRGIGRFCPEIGQNRHISEKSQKYMQKVTLFLAFFTALVEKSNFRHRSTNSTRPNHPKCLTFWLFSRRSAKSPTFDKFRHAASPMPHSPRHMSQAHTDTRNGIIPSERFEKPQAVSELRIEFGCEGRERRPSAVRNGIIHRLRFEKALKSPCRAKRNNSWRAFRRAAGCQRASRRVWLRN